MTLEKIVAVVLAGGVKGFSFREFWHQLEDLLSYREWYFRRGYKSLKKIKVTRGVTVKPKPMVEYILNTLRNIERIDRILVVGPEKEMREQIDPDLLSEGSNIKLIQQKESFGHNVKEGYKHAGQKHVLFVASDSPTTKEEDVSEFIGICEKLYNEYDFIYPLVKESLLKKYYRLFPRPYFKMIPDNIFPADYIDEEDVRKDGRVGFRITSLAFANLENFPVERVDEAYNIRKFYRKSSRDRLKEIFGKNLIRRYRQGLKVSDVENMFSDYEGLRFKLVGLRGAGASLDLDSRRDEKKFNNLYL
ncbi:MAG: NTP transferase domain-containing protein [Deltaproteobacteria bacterium]|nr:NTP transferase domain-containing protein [Deltaproteobacteria bacterium]MBW2116157.1 NTP transferase domain-containing protein [Deltaproteobacteria bacterium]MBW2168368.1 NTP transferase domain-containing protein [Deltaproteobacteria bacterium]